MRLKNLKRTNQILFFGFLIIVGLYYGASLLIPLTFGIFFATLIYPVIEWLEARTGIGKMTSSFIGTLMIFLGVGVLMFFFINQLGIFLQDIMESRNEILNYFQELQRRMAAATGFSLQQQEEMIRESLIDIINTTQAYVSGVLADVITVLLEFLLTLVYVFLLLLNRDKFVDFITMYTSEDNEDRTRKIIRETRMVAHKYLWGRIQVMSILAIMYLVTFTAYGLPHTGLLVIFGALITIIPYIGPFISGLFPVLFMVVFGGSSLEIISFAVLITIIQLIESYLLEPLIIGSEVEQSPLFIIIAIIVGGLLWGPAGLILFVPLFAILKILFDHTRELRPVGFLIGYERPGSGEGIIEKIKKKFKG